MNNVQKNFEPDISFANSKGFKSTNYYAQATDLMESKNKAAVRIPTRSKESGRSGGVTTLPASKKQSRSRSIGKQHVNVVVISNTAKK